MSASRGLWLCAASLVGLDLLEYEVGRAMPVPDGNHRLPALAVRRKGNLGRVPGGGDGAHVVAVRPVARKRGDIGEVARAHGVETRDRPSVDAPIVGVVVLPLAGQYARCREARAQDRDGYSQNKDEPLHLNLHASFPFIR